MIPRVTDQSALPKIIDELLIYLFNGQSHPLTAPMTHWLASSRRFTVFIDTFRDKIRKKLRVTQDLETLNNLRLELETACLLLQEKSLSVVYEPQLGGVRAPDFAVTFTTSLTFAVEVTRIQVPAISTLPVGDQLADTICSKLGQLLHQQSNVIIAGMDTLNLTPSDLQPAMLRVQQRAEGSDPTFWQRYGFRDRADFFRHYQRLSEILVRGSRLQADQPVVVWVNPQAKYPLPGKVRTVLYRSHKT